MAGRKGGDGREGDANLKLINHMSIYLASPMASTKNPNIHQYSDRKWRRNLEIANKLINAGFDIFLPQDNQKESVLKTLKSELDVINSCDFLIAVISDTRGVFLEAGYAKGIGKNIYGICVDETRKLSDWIQCFFDFIAKDADELIKYLNKNYK